MSIKKLSTISLLCAASLMSACSSHPQKIDDMPDGLNVTLMGDAASKFEVEKPWVGLLSGSSTVTFKLVNTTSDDLGAVYGADWTADSGMPTETDNTTAVKMIPAASSTTIVVPASNKDSMDADVSVSLKNLNRPSLMLNENDYKEMITSVISDFRQQLDLNGRSLTVAVDNFENNTDDSTVQMQNMDVFVKKSLQKTGYIRVVQSGLNPDIDLHLSLKMQGGLTDASANHAAYTLILNAHNNQDEEITSSSTLNFHK